LQAGAASISGYFSAARDQSTAALTNERVQIVGHLQLSRFEF
jgi:hypothetical protein